MYSFVSNDGDESGPPITESDVKRVVSCSDTPMNLRPAAEAVVEEALALLPQGKPVVLLMGEDHSKPSTCFMLPAVLHHLSTALSSHGDANDNGPPTIAVGFELDHDLLGKIINADCGIHLSPQEMKTVATMDRNGHRAIFGFLAFVKTRDSPVTMATTLSACRESNLSVRFNDLASTNSNIFVELPILDRNDLRTASYINRSTAQNAREVLYSTCEPGISLRNKAIVDEAMAHIRDTGARLYIQHCGNAHPLGFRGKHGHKNSLAPLFLEAGASVLSVLTSTAPNISWVPPNAHPLAQNSIFITHMPNDLLNRESSFIEELARKSGITFGIHNPYDAPHAASRLRHQFKDQAFGWVREARALLAETPPPKASQKIPFPLTGWVSRLRR